MKLNVLAAIFTILIVVVVFSGYWLVTAYPALAGVAVVAFLIIAVTCVIFIIVRDLLEKRQR